MSSISEAVGALQEADSVCIVAHLRPDADALGSMGTLRLGLEQLGKKTRCVIGQDWPISENLFTIPGTDAVEVTTSLPTGYDLYVTVDCGSLDRTGLLARDLAKAIRRGNVVCIDHHASNHGFGNINLVDVSCESTTTVLAPVLEELGVTLNSEIAHAMYAGLVTDTGSFRWGRPQMHSLAGKLMEYGLDTKQIAVDLMDSNTAEDLQMLGRVLANVQIVPAGKHTMAVLVGRYDVISGHSDSAVETMVDFVRALDGTDLGVVFKEQVPGFWAVSLRSNRVNCSQVARRLGGGGHVPAAGYSTSGEPEDIIAELVDIVGQF